MFALALVLLFEFMIAIVLSRGDYFRPSIIVSGLMFMASVFAAHLSFVWDFEICLEAGSLIILAILVFIIVDSFVARIFTARPKAVTISEVCVSKLVVILVIIFDLIVIYYHIKFLQSNFGSLGSVLSMATMYRSYIAWGVSLSVNMSGFLARALRLSQYFAFIFICVFLNNVISGQKIKDNLLLLTPSVLYMLDSLLFGARGYILYIIFAGVMYGYILYERKHDWRFNSSFKAVKKLVLFLGIAAIGFTVLGNLVGRSSSGSIVYRLARYWGGGIALFNDFILKGGDKSPEFGAYTFTEFYSFMHRRFGWNDYSDISYYEFRTYGGKNWGNVYTALRRYYQDFGYGGALVMVLILAVFFCILYNRVKRTKNGFWGVFCIIYYGILSRSLFLFFFDDEFFSDFCTPSIVMYLFEFMLCLVIVYKPITIKKGKLIFKKNMT